jgi:hypothetical protein
MDENRWGEGLLLVWFGCCLRRKTGLTRSFLERWIGSSVSNFFSGVVAVWLWTYMYSWITKRLAFFQ